MASGIMSYFAPRDTKKAVREAIVGLRAQLNIIDKKEDYLQKKIEGELQIAKDNVMVNKPLAAAALKRKRAREADLENLRGQQMQLEMQVGTLESVNLNAETLAALKVAAGVIERVNGGMSVADVDTTMASIQEGREIAQEIADLISGGVTDAAEDEELMDELRSLEDQVFAERLAGAEHVPFHAPQLEGSTRVEQEVVARATESDEEELRKLQAELAM